MKSYRPQTAAAPAIEAAPRLDQASNSAQLAALGEGAPVASETALLDAFDLASLPEAIQAALTAIAAGQAPPPEAIAYLQGAVRKALDQGNLTLLSAQVWGAMNTTPQTRDGERALGAAREEAKAANPKVDKFDNRYHRGLRQIWLAFQADSSPSEQTALALALAASPQLYACVGGLALSDFVSFGHVKAASWARAVQAAEPQVGEGLWCLYLEGMQAVHLVSAELWDRTPGHLRPDLLARLNRDEVARARLAADPALVGKLIKEVAVNDPSFVDLAAVVVSLDAGLLGDAGLDAWAPFAQLGDLSRLSDAAATKLKALLNPTRIAGSPGLQAWLDAAASTAALGDLVPLFDLRFGLRVTERNGQQFDEAVLRQMWTTLAALPPGHVGGNTALDELRPDGTDNAFATGGHSETSGDVYIGYGPSHATQTLAQVPNVNVGTELQAINALDHTVRHEIGHAVDDGAGVMAANRGLAALGGWETFSSPAAVAKAMVDDGLKGAAEGPLATALSSGEPAQVSALSTEPTVAAAAEVLKEGGARWDGEPLSGIGQHVYKRLGGAWWRYDLASRTNRVSDYQFKSPGEWFAEAYAAYYATGTPGAGLKDVTARDWISANVHRLNAIVDQD
jgi:hypothetical protein